MSKTSPDAADNAVADAAGAARAPRWTLWLPLALFAAFVVLVIVGLVMPRNTDIASQMVGKPLPQFTLRAAIPERPGLATGDFARGKPHLLNIFASWCIPCGVEAPQLAALAAKGIELDGIAIRDRQDDLESFLARNGNPFTRIGADDVSAVQLAIGSSGVPETFVIDGQGRILYQHIGDIRAEEVEMIADKVKEASR